MKVSAWVKRGIKKIVAESGYTIKRIGKENFNAAGKERSSNTLKSALLRLHGIGINPGTVIDVGAAVGSWSENAIRIWPNAHYHLIEPLEEQLEALEQLRNRFSNIKIHVGVAGNSTGMVEFTVSADLFGSGVYGKGANTRMLPILRVEDVVRDEAGPFLIKLDTHGYEIPILEGAGLILEKTDALIIEVYGFYVSPTSVLFHKLTGYMEELGFRVYDIVDVMRREKDLAFWQADAVYLKASHPVFTDNSYK